MEFKQNCHYNFPTTDPMTGKTDSYTDGGSETDRQRQTDRVCIMADTSKDGGERKA